MRVIRIGVAVRVARFRGEVAGGGVVAVRLVVRPAPEVARGDSGQPTERIVREGLHLAAVGRLLRRRHVAQWVVGVGKPQVAGGRRTRPRLYRLQAAHAVGCRPVEG